MIIIFSPCTARKNDAEPIRKGSRIVEPSEYLDNLELRERLLETRKHVLNMPRVQIGDKDTYAFDLYVKEGKAYTGLCQNYYDNLKRRLILDNDVQWFFLSGGYGVIHALERAKNYQASFVRLSPDKNIMYTRTIWQNAGLSAICDAIVSNFKPLRIYVFGSMNYTSFVRQTIFWSGRENLKMFESKGSAGPYWLEPKLKELAEAIINGTLKDFDKKYPNKEYKQ